MLDARGRQIKVGDTISRVYDNSDLFLLARRIRDAILGQVTEMGEDLQGAVVHVGGAAYRSEEILTLSGLEWVACPECGFSWPFDGRMNTEEECPALCGAFFRSEETA